VDSLDERSQTFVVKIWQERRDLPGVPSTWRGSVDDVRTGGRVYFATLRELVDFLKQRSSMSMSTSPYIRLLRRWRKR
jgi:hypothetical protein